MGRLKLETKVIGIVISLRLTGYLFASYKANLPAIPEKICLQQRFYPE
jgi:hypothetical protein